MIEFLKETDIINYSNQNIQKLAMNLSDECKTESEIVKKCFEYVRDHIQHSGDYKNDVATCKASDVLKYKTGWCYAKSHLLAALLRTNNIPTGFCYQRLSCSEYRENCYSLHGLNAVYLKEFGWYRIDARGNKDEVNAQFSPPLEKLAFELQDDEYDLPGIYANPLEAVIEALKRFKTYSEMVDNLPDIESTNTDNNTLEEKIL